MKNAIHFKPVKEPHFHLWCPDIFEFKGGIQVYSAFLLTALQQLHPQGKYQVILKHDRQSSPEFSFLPNTHFHFTGKIPLPWRTWVFAARIAFLAIIDRPDLIIATHVNFTVVADWLKRWFKIPYWVVVHGVEAWNLEKPSLQRALHHADCVVSVSGYTRDRLLKEQQLNPNQIALLPNTFDATRFHITPKPEFLLQRYYLTSQQPIILTVARLDSSQPYKGYDKILHALPRLRQVLPDVHYLIVGKGCDRPRIEQLIDSLQLQDCVTLTGFIPDEELCDHYNLCDVFAMPSLGEGFGIVYLEALACGKPTLGGNQDGAIDALCHGELGVLVNPESVEEIAQALLDILQQNIQNPLLYQPEKLRDKVIEVYGFSSFKQALSHIFKKTRVTLKQLI
ncbi:glycosyltransferase [Spirulina subsalsa]|uniref:glycosyltransferase n=1 Tax=Spirulina subsalsa TaxID=54311 RepID=UPI0003200D60|nr:glycosyltransferase [Spirulina subsalsa]